MCGPTATATSASASTSASQNGGSAEKMVSQSSSSNSKDDNGNKAPVETLLEPPSIMARYTCASVLLGAMSVWGKLTFVPEATAPGVGSPVHDFRVPLALTVGYLVSLPILRIFASKVLSKNVDVKLLLRESMILYNAAQVALNGWMVYRFVHAVLFKGHPFIGDINTVASGATYAVWVHYCDKYLEFVDTYFMVLRGKMDQVSFLHVYHHVSIAWAWWYAMQVWPGGDSYFGALLNSWIHVMMYSYYALSLLKIRCPWKKYLTQSQLLQFLSVLVYTFVSYVKLKGTINWAQKTCFMVQTGEMISLFVLFLHFYQRAYSKKKAQKNSKNSPTNNSDSSDSASDTAAEQASLSSASTDEADEHQTPS